MVPRKPYWERVGRRRYPGEPGYRPSRGRTRGTSWRDLSELPAPADRSDRARLVRSVDLWQRYAETGIPAYLSPDRRADAEAFKAGAALQLERALARLAELDGER